MAIRNSSSRWGALAQFLHWSTVVLILATVPIGWLANSMERGAMERQLFDVHFQLGAAILLLVIARIAWRSLDPAPPLPPGLSRGLRRTAKWTHLLIYAALLTMIVSGYLIQVHMRPSLGFLGLQLPRPFHPGEDESLRAAAWYVHTSTIWLLVGLVAVHAGAALWHHFVKRDDVLTRMMPRFRRRVRRTGQQELKIDDQSARAVAP